MGSFQCRSSILAFIFSVKQEVNYLQSAMVGGIQEALDELSDLKIAVIAGQEIV